MKKFIIKLAVFVVMAIFLTVALLFRLISVLNKEELYTIPEEHHSLIIGDSHPETALNDSLIAATSNFAASGESYFYTYQKLKKIATSNPQIKRVFVELGYGQIEKGMDEIIWGEMVVTNSYPKFWHAMALEDCRLLYLNNFSATLEAQALALKKNLRYAIKGRIASFLWYRHWGGYLALANDASATLNGQPEITEVNSAVAISETNIAYLEKIVGFCKEKQIQIFLIRCPVHKSYQGRKSRVAYDRLRESRFPDIPFLDFQNFPVADSEFADVHHLNQKGARRFSMFFNQFVLTGGLESSVNQNVTDLLNLKFNSENGLETVN